MSKIEKFFRDPASFFRDAAHNRRSAARTGTPTYVVGFSTWKQYLRKFFPDRDLTFLPREISEHEFNSVWMKKILTNKNAEIFVWGFKAPPFIFNFIKKNNVKVIFVEDGFVRSVQLGATKAPPMSLCLDTRTPYFNARKPSDLEVILSEYDFSADIQLAERATRAMELLVSSGVSKYNNAARVDIELVYGPKTSKRILVIGQVEDDASIEFGCDHSVSNNDVVRLAAKENPGAQIIYKPHPDVLEGHRPKLSDPEEVRHIAQILSGKMPMSQALSTIDHVYTITSLAGFEALLRGIKVTTIGAPFYSGWGLTDDRQVTPRRVRKLELTQLFAGAYLLYPRYFDAASGAKRELEDTVEHIQLEYKKSPSLAEKSLEVNDAAPVPAAKLNPGFIPTILVGDFNYKTLLGAWFDERRFGHIPSATTEKEFIAKFKKALDGNKHAEYFVLGDDCAPYLKKYIGSSRAKVTYINDGFIRSEMLDPKSGPPYSLLLDRRAPHYDARTPTDLEEILNGYDFGADNALMERTANLLSQLLASGLSKYNHARRVSKLQDLYGVKVRSRVLVLGQDERAASFKLSNPRNHTIDDLVTIAAMENPGAQIIFKPHPLVMKKLRPVVSQPSKFKPTVQILEQDIPIAQALETIDRVYTISSHGGFEALMRGIPTTVLGVPFYAGWGIGDDRQNLTRRQRKLTIEQVFAAAYILYPVYVDPLYKMASSAERIISRLKEVVENIPTQIDGNDLVNDRLERAAVKTAATAKVVAGALPEWFQPHMGPELRNKINGDKPVFLYFPWIAEHGDTLIARIDGGDDYTLAPIDLVRGIDDNEIRRNVLKFARENPHTYRQMIARRLVPLRGRVKGIILTFDWAPVMRIIANVCEELEIPRILIPHESVFVDRDKYYWDPKGKASVPIADIILGWGDLQREIFVERGYPDERFIVVGAPKFDSYANYTPQLSRAQFCRLFGLRPERKVVIFASQPLDSQLDMTIARTSQRKAILDLLDYAEENDCQVLVRLPPSKDDILGPTLRERLVNSVHGAVDDATCYLVAPEEALYHADVVTSVNSTMLFEGVLLGRPAVSLKYVEFSQIWVQAGIPSVTSRTELDVILGQMLAGAWTHPAEGLAWAAHMFGAGKFDGAASVRIREQLTKIVNSGAENKMLQLPGAIDRLFAGERVDVVGIPSSEAVLARGQKYLTKMLRAKNYVNSSKGLADMQTIASADLFIQWGITPKAHKEMQREAARALGRPIVIVEDGFIRSMDIGLSGESGLSIILDDTTAYYDATRPSRLQRLLESGPDLTTEQVARSRSAIEKIASARVSKYNHAPVIPLKIGTPGKKKILLIDQRFGDQSVSSGLADVSTFLKMLQDVLRERTDCDIIIKQHPDAIKGGKSSYFSNERVAPFIHCTDNVHTVAFDVNPYSLFEIVDEVYVATSGMGFEALMAGKTVHCYGAPFYAGWGATVDQLEVAGRSRKRSLEDLFHFAYIESSRYFDPERDEVVEVEEMVDYIVSKRGW
jgi:capsule polysaccharide export protein KpsC/LpsZ